MTDPLRPADLKLSSDPEKLLNHARSLVNHSIREVDSANREFGTSVGLPKVAHKGGVGRIVEAYFGFQHQDNNPEPDFPRCDTELKTLPLLRTKHGFRVKERTIISMIDFTDLYTQTWETSSVRRKLSRILFVFLQWSPPSPYDSVVAFAEPWVPTEADLAFFEADWTYTWRMVCCGQADLISEADAQFLAPSRKGAGKGRDERSQPNSPFPANSRAFSLKQSFTTATFQEIVEGKRFQSVVSGHIPEIRYRGFREIEGRILTSITPFVGQSLGALSSRLGLDLSGGKDRAAKIVKRLLGALDVASEVREFTQAGLQVKTLSLRSGNGAAYEAVSFPAADLDRLVVDSWEDSQLRQDLGRVLFVPTYRPSRDTVAPLRTLGPPFFWTPTRDQWEIIRREWTDYKRQVISGQARYEVVPGQIRRRGLLKHESETTIIHMRPHGANAADQVVNPQGEQVTKQCFWLNKEFVARLVKENKALAEPREAGARPSSS